MQRHHLEIADQLDIDGRLSLTRKGGNPAFIDKADAEQIIAHLQKVFKLNEPEPARAPYLGRAFRTVRAKLGDLEGAPLPLMNAAHSPPIVEFEGIVTIKHGGSQQEFNIDRAVILKDDTPTVLQLWSTVDK